MRIKKIKPYLEVAPVVFVVGFVLIFGIVGAFLQSLGYFPQLGMTKVGFDNYSRIFSDQSFLRSLGFTLYITLVSSIISVFLGVVLARIVVSTKFFKSKDVFQIPIMVPHIVVALFAITFLSDSGVLARILYNIGFKNSSELMSSFLFNRNGVGIIISYVWKEAPYVLITCFAVMRRISAKHEMAARNLGASPLESFLKVTLPMISNTVVYTFNIIFAFSFGAYEIPMLLGPTVPKTLPIQAFIEYQNPDLTNRPYSMAINMTILFFCVIFVMVFGYFVNKIIYTDGSKKIKNS